MAKKKKDYEIGYDVLAAAALSVLIGLVLGYLMYPAFNEEQRNAEAAALDMSKVGEMKAVFEDLLALQDGAQHSVEYENYSELGEVVDVQFTVDGSVQHAYVSKEFKYLFQQPIEFEELKRQIEIAKGQANATG